MPASACLADLLARLQSALADRYAIERELGRAGMATVYLARDLKHHRKVAIKDLKPDLAAPLGLEGVSDFGMARATSAAAGGNRTARGVAIGTPAYMRPEQASGHSQIDGRTDINALGCLLYGMLAGDPPFLAPTPQAVLARQSL